MTDWSTTFGAMLTLWCTFAVGLMVGLLIRDWQHARDARRPPAGTLQPPEPWPGPPTRPTFPANRVLREGEPACAYCGSGERDHWHRDHAYTPWSRA